MMSLPRAPLVIASLGLWLSACQGDPPATDTADTTGDATTQDPTTAAPTTSTSAPTTAMATTEDAPVTVEYARGMRLTRATANQGVQVEIVREGVEVSPDSYAARLISRRKTVVRADWLLHADFTPREIIGRLTIWTPEGDTRVDEFKTMVDGPSNDGDLYKTFSWELPPDFVRPGLEYRIEAIEPDPASAGGEVSDPPPVLPLPGRGTLAVAEAPMEIKVVLVPVKHVFDGDTCMPEITDDDVGAMQRWIEQHNPVERAVLTVREPMEYTKSIGTDPDGFVPILVALSEAREADAPGDNVYYYGLLQSCDAYPPGLLGQAIGIPDAPTRGNAFQRLSTGRYLGSGSGARDTFVHEVGHSQGRYHIRCSGGEAGVDLDYPHPNGRIGVWGYGIHDTTMRSPSAFRDYMSYCEKSWVSDFGWELTFDTIATLTAWDSEDAAEGEEPAKVPILVGALMPSGRTAWWTTMGAVPQRGRAPGLAVEFDLAGALLSTPASVETMPDSDAELVVAELPDDLSTLRSLSLRQGGQIRAKAGPDQIKRLHAQP